MKNTDTISRALFNFASILRKEKKLKYLCTTYELEIIYSLPYNLNYLIFLLKIFQWFPMAYETSATGQLSKSPAFISITPCLSSLYCSISVFPWGLYIRNSFRNALLTGFYLTLSVPSPNFCSDILPLEKLLGPLRK